MVLPIMVSPHEESATSHRARLTAVTGDVRFTACNWKADHLEAAILVSLTDLKATCDSATGIECTRSWMFSLTDSRDCEQMGSRAICAVELRLLHQAGVYDATKLLLCQETLWSRSL